MGTAAITGASGGIGRAMVHTFAQAGYDIALLDLTEPRLPKDARGVAMAVDLTEPEAVAGAFERIGAEFGRLDALVNIAGINHRSPISDMDAEDWDRLMATNVGAMFLTAKFGVPLLEKGMTPSIVNLASVSGHVASPDYPAYVTSKAAVEKMTRILAREVGKLKITVNAVGPSPVKTDLIKAVAPDKVEAVLARQAIDRFATTADIVNVIDFFLRPESDFVTGQVVYLGGV